ncbi:alpha/beta hydrolase [Mycoplasma todarodis]|uniref:alpha/beta hydrolase n=1 Tax=Mycoplasma todarodis TaxID=1937191 RepID=UPI003B3844A2
MKKRILKLRDGKKVRTYIWDNVDQPKGMVQLIHGSLEHGKRYDELANVFNKAGYIVVADDHRGHGETDDDMLGHVGVNVTAQDIVNDLKEINAFYYKKYQLPVVVYGHSWGSYLARTLISQKGVKVDKVIISGSGWETQFATSFGLGFLKMLRLFKKDHEKSKMVFNITFKKFNKGFAKNSETGMEWLSNDEKENNKFYNDKLRGDQFSISGYRALLGAAKLACNKHTLTETPNIDILIVSGADDPVGKKSKGVTKFYNKLKKFNDSNVTLKLYKGQRHEIHNDTEREVLFKDIEEFLK